MLQFVPRKGIYMCVKVSTHVAVRGGGVGEEKMPLKSGKKSLPFYCLAYVVTG